MLTSFAPNQIQDDQTRQAIIGLLNLVEELKRESRAFKKLKVSFFASIYDRVSGAMALPSLAQLIEQRSPAFHPISLTVAQLEATYFMEVQN
jgi:hypothetical protein